MVQGKINRGRHTDPPAGRHSIRTNQCPPPPSPHYVYRLDALPAPSQQCQSTEGNYYYYYYYYYFQLFFNRPSLQELLQIGPGTANENL